MRKGAESHWGNNRMIYNIDKNSGSCRKLHKIKKIRYKPSKKSRYSSSDSSSTNSDYLLYSDSEQDKTRQPTERKEINKFDRVVTNNIKTNKNQQNGAIEYEPRFYNKFSLSSGTKDPLSVVTVRLIGGKKKRGGMASRLIFLWDS